MQNELVKVTLNSVAIQITNQDPDPEPAEVEEFEISEEV